MLRRIASLTAATLLAVVTSVTVAASPAMAGENAMAWTYSNSIARGQAVWYHDGDSLKVCDMSADGRGIKGALYSYNSSGGFWELEFTVTDSNSSDGCKYGSENVPDGRTVEVLVYQYWGNETCCGETSRGVA
ncbi:hypothetical protein [Micromonospora sp. KC213]|uniref:hypothetical protein n=1 Tax=Micromonospora sp. KC213 TaxID=2530378 RepID=UPI0010495941|nr:hypothetical protein [Micromonospora sp. KC213]TDC29849.1 hypothetical protein E1166_29575 [Micromonospora sp. KC213]